MDMTSVNELVITADPDRWRPGDSWLAGGTVLLSYGTDVTRGRPQRLLDITAAGWPDLTWLTHPDGALAGLEIAATCRIATMYALPSRPDLPLPRRRLPALDLFRPCCDSFVAGWKIWNVSTVGGNVATALPAGSMTSLLAGLDARAALIGPGGDRRLINVAELVIGETLTGLGDGELIRSFTIGADVLAQPCAFRRISLRERGRSAALLIGRRTGPGKVRIVVTASTRRPHVIDLGSERHPATVSAWRAAIDASVAAEGWHNDMHGLPQWRRAMTHRLGEELLAELLPDAPTGAEGAIGRHTGDLHLDQPHDDGGRR